MKPTQAEIEAAIAAFGSVEDTHLRQRTLEEKLTDVLKAAAAVREEHEIQIVFDGPPGPTAGRFVEVEDSFGRSIRFGEWIERGDGYWALRFFIKEDKQ